MNYLVGWTSKELIYKSDNTDEKRVSFKDAYFSDIFILGVRRTRDGLSVFKPDLKEFAKLEFCYGIGTDTYNIIYPLQGVSGVHTIYLGNESTSCVELFIGSLGDCVIELTNDNWVITCGTVVLQVVRPKLEFNMIGYWVEMYKTQGVLGTYIDTGIYGSYAVNSIDYERISIGYIKSKSCKNIWYVREVGYNKYDMIDLETFSPVRLSLDELTGFCTNHKVLGVVRLGRRITVRYPSMLDLCYIASNPDLYELYQMFACANAYNMCFDWETCMPEVHKEYEYNGITYTIDDLYGKAFVDVVSNSIKIFRSYK